MVLAWLTFAALILIGMGLVVSGFRKGSYKIGAGLGVMTAATVIAHFH